MPHYQIKYQFASAASLAVEDEPFGEMVKTKIEADDEGYAEAILCDQLMRHPDDEVRFIETRRLYDPALDGVDHINIYSKGKTKLGRLLTNFAAIPVELSEGTFASVEGFWFWLGTGDDRLRKLSGWEAKKLGEELGRTIEIPNFEDKIRQALWLKMDQHAEIRRELVKSSLPFAHYYVYGSKVREAGYEWLTQEWELIRKILKGV